MVTVLPLTTLITRRTGSNPGLDNSIVRNPGAKFNRDKGGVTPKRLPSTCTAAQGDTRKRTLLPELSSDSKSTGVNPWLMSVAGNGSGEIPTVVKLFKASAEVAALAPLANKAADAVNGTPPQRCAQRVWARR